MNRCWQKTDRIVYTHSKLRHVNVICSPNGGMLEVNCELETGRKIYQIPIAKPTSESPPHGAGSFHDPAQHAVYMDRVEALLHGG
jgi:hypothetical protein